MDIPLVYLWMKIKNLWTKTAWTAENSINDLVSCWMRLYKILIFIIFSSPSLIIVFWIFFTDLLLLYYTVIQCYERLYFLYDETSKAPSFEWIWIKGLLKKIKNFLFFYYIRLENYDFNFLYNLKAFRNFLNDRTQAYIHVCIISDRYLKR